jgi:hypothetical protein
MASAFKEHLMSLVGFLATVCLTLISIYVAHLGTQGSFVVFATGTVVSVGLGMIEERLNSGLREMESNVKAVLVQRLELYRIMEQIDDEELRTEVLALARSLGGGEIPAYIAATRVPKLYARAQKSIYASNYSPTRDRLYQWETSPRLKGIVETSRVLATRGVKVTRTFILRRSELMTGGGVWDERSLRVLQRQREVGIEVRIIWAEDLERDHLAPRLNLIRNFTLFDGIEALETTDSQVVYRRPSDRVLEFVRLQEEQFKYSEGLVDAMTVALPPSGGQPIT